MDMARLETRVSVCDHEDHCIGIFIYVSYWFHQIHHNTTVFSSLGSTIRGPCCPRERRDIGVRLRWPRPGHGNEEVVRSFIGKVSIPIPSMGLEYLPTWMVAFYGKCRETMGKFHGMGYVLVSCFSNIDLWISMIWSGWFFCVLPPCFFRKFPADFATERFFLGSATWFWSSIYHGPWLPPSNRATWRLVEIPYLKTCFGIMVVTIASCKGSPCLLDSPTTTSTTVVALFFVSKKKTHTSCMYK